MQMISSSLRKVFFGRREKLVLGRGGKRNRDNLLRCRRNLMLCEEGNFASLAIFKTKSLERLGPHIKSLHTGTYHIHSSPRICFVSLISHPLYVAPWRADKTKELISRQ